MFQAALVAAHHNPALKTFADRLRKAGKPHKVIIIAVARKLVTVANALQISVYLDRSTRLIDTVARDEWGRAVL